MLMVLLPAASLPSAAQEHPPGRLAYVDRNRNLWVIDADGANRRQLTFDGKYDEGLDWSFDGQYLAYGYYHSRGDRLEDWAYTLRIVHVGSAQVIYELQDAWPQQWYSGSHRLKYYDASQDQNMLLDADTLTAEPVLANIHLWSPDGRFGATMVCEKPGDTSGWGQNCRIEVVDLANQLVLASTACRSATPVKFSHDSSQIVFVSPHQTIGVMSVDSTETRVYDSAELYYGSDYIPAWTLTFTLDGKSIVYWASGQQEGFSRGILSLDLDTGIVSQVLDFKEDVGVLPAFSSDGLWVGYPGTERGNYYIAGLRGQGAYVISIDPIVVVWEPMRSKGDDGRAELALTLEDLLYEKRELIPLLEDPKDLELFGLPILNAPGYDETSARNLVAFLEGQQQALMSGQLAADEEAALGRQTAAFERYVCQEEVTAKVYPHYASTASDMTHAALEMMLVLLSFVTASEEAAKKIAEEVPFGKEFYEMVGRQNQILINQVHDLADATGNWIEDEHRREAWWQFWDHAFGAAKLILQSQGAPLSFADVFSLMEEGLGYAATHGLLAYYTGSTQYAINMGAQRVWESADAWAFDLYVRGDEEELFAQSKRLTNEAQNQAESVHYFRVEFDKLANWSGLLSTIADVTTFGTLSTLVRVAEVTGRGYEFFFVGIPAWGFLLDMPERAWQYCFDTTTPFEAMDPGALALVSARTDLESAPVLASRLQPVAYDPQQPPRLNQTVVNDRLTAEQEAITPLVDNPETVAYTQRQLLALDQAINEYQTTQEQVTTSLQAGDVRAAADRLHQLGEAEDRLAAAFTLARAPILAAAPEMDRANLGHQLQQMGQLAQTYHIEVQRLYSALASVLLDPEDPEAQLAAIAQSSELNHCIHAYRQEIEALLPAVTSAVVLPDIRLVGHSVDGLHLEVEVTEASPAPVHGVTLEVVDVTTVTLGDMAGGETRVVGFDLPASGFYIVRAEAEECRGDSRFLWIPEAPADPGKTLPVAEEPSEATLAVSTGQDRLPIPLPWLVLLICAALVSLSTTVWVGLRLWHRGSKRGNQQEAIAALPLPPFSQPLIDDLLQQGIDLVNSRQLEEATMMLRRVIDMAPDNSEAWLWLGWAAVGQSDMRTAWRCFAEAKRLGHPSARQALRRLRGNTS